MTRENVLAKSETKIDEWQKQANDLVSMEQELQTMSDNVSKIYNTTFVNVCQQLGDTGKAKFSNESARDAETARLLAESKDFVQAQKAFTEKQIQVKIAKNRLEAIRMDIGVHKAYLNGSD